LPLEPLCWLLAASAHIPSRKKSTDDRSCVTRQIAPPQAMYSLYSFRVLLNLTVGGITWLKKL
jgi:hypothetical protein